jgi:hypothetical protein
MNERNCTILTGVSFALALVFGLITLRGNPATMGAGILNFMLACHCLSWSALCGGMALYQRARPRPRISFMYGAAVGILFALGASIIVIMIPQVGPLTVLVVLALSAALILALAAGGSLLLAVKNGRRGRLWAVPGALLVLAVAFFIAFVSQTVS